MKPVMAVDALLAEEQSKKGKKARSPSPPAQKGRPIAYFPLRGQSGGFQDDNRTFGGIEKTKDNRPKNLSFWGRLAANQAGAGGRGPPPPPNKNSFVFVVWKGPDAFQ